MLVHWICDLQTGQKDLQVYPISGNWQRKLIGYGNGSHTFQVQGAEFSADDRAIWRSLLNQDWSRVLVVSWVDEDDPSVDYPLYAGVITAADPKSDGTVTIDHSEVRIFLDVRLPFTTYAASSVVLANRSWRGIITQSLVLAVAGATRYIPLVFPFYDESGPETVEVPNWEFKTIEEIVADAQKADGGPDFELRQGWDFSNRLLWTIRLGNPALSGPQMEFNITSAEPGQLDYKSSHDGSKVATRVWGTGNGSGSIMKVGDANLGTAPAKERIRSFKSEDNVDVLNGNAFAEATTFSSPTRQPSVTVPLSEAMSQGFELGSPVRLLFADHWWEYDGAQDFRLVGYGNDGSDKLELMIQED